MRFLQGLHQRFYVCWQGSAEFDPFAARGMVKAQSGRVKRLAWEVNHSFSNAFHGIASGFADAAVGWVPNEAMANVAHMHPDLMRASRFKLARN